MEKIHQDIDALTGLQTTSFVDHEGVLHVNYQQDAEASFEMVKSARNEGAVWKRGMKRSFAPALHIPDGVILELRAIGVNVYTAPLKDLVAGLRKINRYDACDVSGKRLV